MLEPQKQSPELHTLDRLVGSWKLSGPELDGEVAFQWFSGGHFLVQGGTIRVFGKEMTFVEYIGWNEEQKALTSHMFDNAGHVFQYYWQLEGQELSVYFGSKDSDNHLNAIFNDVNDMYSGAWMWPGGGYEVKAEKIA